MPPQPRDTRSIHNRFDESEIIPYVRKKFGKGDDQIDGRRGPGHVNGREPCRLPALSLVYACDVIQIPSA